MSNQAGDLNFVLFVWFVYIEPYNPFFEIFFHGLNNASQIYKLSPNNASQIYKLSPNTTIFRQAGQTVYKSQPRIFTLVYFIYWSGSVKDL